MENAYGIEGNLTYDITPWLFFSGNANFYRSIINGEFEGNNLDRDIYSAQFQSTLRAKVSDFDFQLRGRYRTPHETTQGRRLAFYTVDFGVNYQILKGKGTFNLNAVDILNSRKYRGTTELSNYYSEDEFQWRSRQVTLSFTYQINQRRQKNGRGNGNGGGDFNGGGDMEF